jgi:hypothetical protein
MVADTQQQAEELVQGASEAYPDMMIRVAPPMPVEAIPPFIQAFDELEPIDE